MPNPHCDHAERLARPRTGVFDDQTHHAANLLADALLLAVLSWDLRDEQVSYARGSAGAWESNQPIAIDVAI